MDSWFKLWVRCRNSKVNVEKLWVRCRNSKVNIELRRISDVLQGVADVLQGWFIAKRFASICTGTKSQTPRYDVDETFPKEKNDDWSAKNNRDKGFDHRVPIVWQFEALILNQRRHAESADGGNQKRNKSSGARFIWKLERRSSYVWIGYAWGFPEMDLLGLFRNGLGIPEMDDKLTHVNLIEFPSV